MSEESRSPEPSDPDRAADVGAGRGDDARRRAVRRRRLAEVFGDVLPETTGDERTEDGVAPQGREDWLRGEVPPHHGA